MLNLYLKEKTINIKKAIINENIQANNLLLINQEGVSYGKVSYDQAMLLAHEKGLDVMLVSENPKMAVAKLINYNKAVYREEKAKRKQKAHSKNLELKEIKLSIKIDKHDLDTKARRAKKFLKKGHKVRLVVFLRGRENLFADQVHEMMNKFVDEIDAEYEQRIKRAGSRFTAIVKPKKK